MVTGPNLLDWLKVFKIEYITFCKKKDRLKFLLDDLTVLLKKLLAINIARVSVVRLIFIPIIIFKTIT
mgnify:CR=1 FL=1